MSVDACPNCLLLAEELEDTKDNFAILKGERDAARTRYNALLVERDRVIAEYADERDAALARVQDLEEELQSTLGTMGSLQRSWGEELAEARAALAKIERLVVDLGGYKCPKTKEWAMTCRPEPIQPEPHDALGSLKATLATIRLNARCSSCGYEWNEVTELNHGHCQPEGGKP